MKIKYFKPNPTFLTVIFIAIVVLLGCLGGAILGHFLIRPFLEYCGFEIHTYSIYSNVYNSVLIGFLLFTLLCFKEYTGKSLGKFFIALLPFGLDASIKKSKYYNVFELVFSCTFGGLYGFLISYSFMSFN